MIFFIVVVVVFALLVACSVPFLSRRPKRPTDQGQKTSTDTIPPAHPDPRQAPPGSSPRRDD